MKVKSDVTVLSPSSNVNQTEQSILQIKQRIYFGQSGKQASWFYLTVGQLLG